MTAFVRLHLQQLLHLGHLQRLAALRLRLDCRMYPARVGLTVLTLFMPVVISACSEGDTVLALNASLRPGAGTARQLTVTVAQPGQADVEVSLVLATMETDAGTVLKSDTLVERITLPSSYSDGEASLRVTASDSAGAAVASAMTTFEVRQHGAVAGFVTLGEEPEPVQDSQDNDEQDAGL